MQTQSFLNSCYKHKVGGFEPWSFLCETPEGVGWVTSFLTNLNINFKHIKR